MADRRTDDTPVAAPRPRSGSDGSTSVGRDRSASGGTQVGTTGTTASRADGDRSAVGSVLGGGSSGSGAATARGTTTQQRPRGTRRARLRLVHLDPWSVMKTAFLLSIALGIVTVVAVAVVWSVLSAAGVWDSINKAVTDVLGGDAAQNFDVENYVGTSRVLGFTMVVAVLDVILVTAIATLGAFLYNLAAALLGGIELTLAEDER